MDIVGDKYRIIKDTYGYVEDNSAGYFDGISWFDIHWISWDIMGYLGWISYMEMLPKDIQNI